MTFETFFEEVKKKLMDADASNITEHLAYQFNITGEAEGIFYVEVKEGKLYVEPYEYYDRDVIFTCSAKTLRKIAEGKTDPILAVTLQKLKVDGNIDKALKLKTLLGSKE
ncbi:MAG: SCP2 sterol-binding domain-containing protein [Lachnospiraceae bacterium]|nr:SCP2 sterol-binding domain-containing protein [Lachnospiraceae bacterium]